MKQPVEEIQSQMSPKSDRNGVRTDAGIVNTHHKEEHTNLRRNP